MEKGLLSGLTYTKQCFKQQVDFSFPNLVLDALLNL